MHFSCKLPNPEVAVEGKLTVVKAVNTCGFDVTIHFDVRYDSRNGTHHKFRLKKCGGKDSWNGPVEWKLSPFTLDYDDTVIVVCK